MSRNHHHLLLSNLETKSQRGQLRLNPKVADPNGHLSVGLPQLNFKYYGRSYGPVQPMRIRRFLGKLDEAIRKKNQPDLPVVFYIPGWNHKALVTLDLFSQISQRYCDPKKPAVSTFIFFQWMTGEFTDILNKRHQIDDGTWKQALDCGQLLQNLLIEVSDHLKKKGIPFYLMTHSYAHQFLNGLIYSWSKDGVQELVFDKAFLFASDISWKSLNISPGGRGGVKLINPNDDPNDAYRQFDLTPLKDVSKETQVITCTYDYLLHHSQSMILSEVLDYAQYYKLKVNPTDYVGLGVSGTLWAKSSSSLPENIYVHDVYPLIEEEYKESIRDKELRFMELLLNGELPEHFKSSLTVALNAQTWKDLHRYLFLSSGVHQFLREELRF